MPSDSIRPEDWWFKKQPPGQSHSPGLLQKKTLDRSLETFVREVLQNINDAGLDNDEPVEVTFRLHELEETRKSFEDAICWNSLIEHVRAAAEEQDGPGLQDYVDYLDDGGTLRVLVAEEKNTSGIQGDEVSTDGDYAALVRDPGSSNKSGDTGGRHGLGSSVLWVASGLQTVLFDSYLNEELPEQESPRLVGRSFVPTHQTPDGQWYDNEGWFGSPTGLEDPDLERPESMWADVAEELAEELSLSRPNEAGTSTMIVGFRDPSDPSMEDQPSPSDVADTFERTAADYFWPAISRGDLKVHLNMEGDERHITGETIRDHDSVAPFIECYESRADASKSLGGPGDVASREFEYEIRSRKDEETPSEGSVSLAARRAYPYEEDRVGEIALFRGSGMVVQYKPGHHLGFSEKFHGVLACGNARPVGDDEPTDEDSAIDKFLAMAEPPAHDDWVGEKNDELKGTYESGCVKCVKRLKKELLRTHLSKLLYGTRERSGESIRPDRDIVPKTKRSRGRETETSTPTVATPFDWEVTASNVDGNRWAFEGWVEPDVDEQGEVVEWSVTVEMAAMFEDNREASKIPVEEIDVGGTSSDGRVEDGRGVIEVEENPEKATFEIRSEAFSDSDPRLGDVGETKFKIVDGSIGIEEVSS
ncbi:hypothetical protein SAMN04487947_2018 [Halogeometricum rufum]|uniref:Uncharacterized protein n=1 Tax=Halogeometricum rufum TaxID=553469 RepID=A0A1I6HFP3_9EURY|nr:hypothetical protein [Halogeometricum rufum]SFR53313.1 hypothetical protein SAMN04487947_2018 [Halogeometricum rufum]